MLVGGRAVPLQPGGQVGVQIGRLLLQVVLVQIPHVEHILEQARGVGAGALNQAQVVHHFGRGRPLPGPAGHFALQQIGEQLDLGNGGFDIVGGQLQDGFLRVVEALELGF
ncbi:hypothetical protein H9L05_21605 (plasmid) [Hymenobacter qilianensis]|uniref:Uncharacterized protein n=1 Tax=Hymenobacter qilianensis TaxID=1385715 RepID=A0A7H0H154_9BACT|nr:hypothetical protein H9L05_21605 [Hymenobacter qilianensis]